MRYEKYKEDFEKLYPDFGAAPLMEKFGLTRRKVSTIASALQIPRKERDRRFCVKCEAPLAGTPSYAGNYCPDCFNARRRKLEKEDTRICLRTLFHRAKIRSSKKETPFNITQEHLMELWETQHHRCYYSGIEMNSKESLRDPYGVSIDRRVPEKGYTVGNVVLCCWGVNTAKQEFSMKDFLYLCQKVTEHQLRPHDGGDPGTGPLG
jgi:hypothetical protein